MAHLEAKIKELELENSKLKDEIMTLKSSKEITKNVRVLT